MGKGFDRNGAGCRFASVFLHFSLKTMISQFRLEGVVSGLNFDVNLEPNKRVYCFIGKNGVGKTKMLEGLGKSLLFCHSLFDEGNATSYPFWKYSKVQDEFGKQDLHLPSIVHLQQKQIKDVKKNPSRDTWDIIPLEQIPAKKNFFKYPVSQPLVFINAKNRGYLQTALPRDSKVSSNNKDVSLLGDLADRFIIELGGLLANMNGIATPTNAVARWCIERGLINPQFIQGNENRFHEVEAVLELLQAIEPSWNLVVTDIDGKKQYRLFFRESELFVGETAIDYLSTGYASILKIFQEIIAGYGAWTNADDLRNVEGIVFIDEIESHLHAEWQAKIIPLLKKSFPKTTFFIATHSPLIVSTTDQDEAYELVPEAREDGTFVIAKKLGNPRNWYLADVYEQAFHVDITSIMDDAQSDDSTPSVTEMLKDFGVLVKDYQGKPSDALKEKIFSLYNEIVPNVPDTDPRRSSLELLRRLVK